MNRRRRGGSREKWNGWFRVAVTATLLTLAKVVVVVSGRGENGRKERGRRLVLDANLQMCRKGSDHGSNMFQHATVWERNGLLLEITKSRQCIDMRNASRKSQPNIILTTTKKRRSKPSNITAQTRVKKRGNSRTGKKRGRGQNWGRMDENSTSVLL